MKIFSFCKKHMITTLLAMLVFSGSGLLLCGEEVYAAASVPRMTNRRFAQELSDMVDEYDGYVSRTKAARDPFLSARLILKSASRTLNPAEYDAIEAIQDLNGHYILQFETSAAAKLALEKLEQEPATIYVEPDRYVFPAVSGVHDRKENEIIENWGVSAIGADKYAWYLNKIGKTGSVRVAVLDSGIRKTHEQFAGRLSSVNEYDYYNKDADASDEYGHGTQVAGVIASCTADIEGISIIPIRVLGPTGTTSFSICASAVKELSGKVDVLNLSFTMGSKMISELSDTLYQSCLYMEESVADATQNGTLVVIAAGNSGGDSSNYAPANITDEQASGCIVVGACNQNKTPRVNSNYGESVDLSAPGSDIVTSYYKSDISYGTNSGTSFAAPHVAAAAAMLKLYNPSLTPVLIESILENSASPLSNSTGRNYGSGVLNLSNLIPAEYLNEYEQYLADKEAAGAVMELISDLPKPVTLTDKAAVEVARAAYESLTDDQKALVTNLDVLTVAESIIAKLEEDKAAAQVVIDQINGLPETVSITDKEAVEAVRTAYNALTDGQKEFVTNYSVLTQAEETIADIEKAQAVIDQINALPETVKITDKEAVEAALAAYNALTDDQRALVDNVSLLSSADARLQELIRAAEEENEKEQVESENKYPRSDPKPNVAYRVPLKKKQKTRVLKVIGLADGDKVVSWESSNKKRARVMGQEDGTCLIRAGKKTGKVRITAVTASGKKVIFKLRVQSGKVKTKKIRIAKRTIRISVGESYVLEPLLYPVTSVQKISYSSKNEFVAAVSSQGIVQGITAGTTRVVIYSGNAKLKVKVIVS